MDKAKRRSDITAQLPDVTRANQSGEGRHHVVGWETAESVREERRRRIRFGCGENWRRSTADLWLSLCRTGRLSGDVQPRRSASVPSPVPPKLAPAEVSPSSQLLFTQLFVHAAFVHSAFVRISTDFESRPFRCLPYTCDRSLHLLDERTSQSL
jgi:hypothetical protein